MIAVLINDTVERMVVLRQVFWLQGILENGFTGFAHWSDEDLRHELCGRGFDPAHSGDESGDCDPYDEHDGDEFLRLAGHLGSGSQLQYQ